MTGFLQVLAFILGAFSWGWVVFKGLPFILGAFSWGWVVFKGLPFLRWCRRHWGKLLTLAIIAVWVLSLMMIIFSAHYDPALRVWMLMGSTISSFVLTALVWDQPKKPTTTEPQPLPPGRLTLPSDYFMPYCVCPRCDAEALHWISTPSAEWCKVMSPSDLVRECRSCKFKWGQQVGLVSNVLR